MLKCENPSQLTKRSCGVHITSCIYTSAAFEQAWENFLDKHKLAKEPLLYQHITDNADPEKQTKRKS